MKRITAIAQSLILSMLIIALGGGVALVTCNRSNTTEMELLGGMDYSKSDMADAGCGGAMQQEAGQSHSCKGCTAAPVKSCMSVKVVKLAPMVFGSHASFHFINIPHFIANIEWKPLVEFLPHTSFVPMWWERTAFVSPPKAYLHLLRMLTI